MLHIADNLHLLRGHSPGAGIMAAVPRGFLAMLEIGMVRPSRLQYL